MILSTILASACLIVRAWPSLQISPSGVAPINSLIFSAPVITVCAEQARLLLEEEEPEVNVHVFNSCSAASGELLVAMAIHRLASTGMPYADSQRAAHMSGIGGNFVHHLGQRLLDREGLAQLADLSLRL